MADAEAPLTKMIDTESAFGKGARLWVFSKKDTSRLEKLDWLLNFQITEANHHQAHELPPRVQEILGKCELKDLDFIEPRSENLLISSYGFLPNEWVLLIEPQSKKSWVPEIYKNWLSLGEPTLRVFLPEEMSQDSFEKEWRKHADKNVEVVGF